MDLGERETNSGILIMLCFGGDHKEKRPHSVCMLKSVCLLDFRFSFGGKVLCTEREGR